MLTKNIFYVVGGFLKLILYVLLHLIVHKKSNPTHYIDNDKNENNVSFFWRDKIMFISFIKQKEETLLKATFRLLCLAVRNFKKPY